ncbi:putative D,D-dipeptide transport system permease protein DdpC [bacterium BMS3Abin14]|nr:putative D,D-dipeptide transport system permease protein DdpC [bacterium BMS3Abin14]
MRAGAKRSYSRMVWEQFARDRVSIAGLIFVLALFAVALGAPLLAGNRPLIASLDGHIQIPVFSKTRGVDWKGIKDSGRGWAIFPLVPYSPTEIDLEANLLPPDGRHFLGTDDRGRDVLARMIYGSRVSLSVGFVAVSIYAFIGVFLGALAGYYGGKVDVLISRAIEVMMCFPTFFLILTVLAFLRPSIYNIMIIIGVTGWPGVARLVRGEFLKQRKMDYVAAAKAIGASDRRIIFYHILPNAIAPVLVSATFGIAGAILVESSLSYLGFGVPPPTPSWGEILSQSKHYIDFAWWLTIFPGVAIFLTVTAYNLVGEGLRDAVDPRLK